MKKLVVAILICVMVFMNPLAYGYADNNYDNLFTTPVQLQQNGYKQKFWDVDKNHWAFSSISELTNRGAINGYNDGSFKPDNTVTRAEWAKIMIQAAGLLANDYSVRFKDMAGHWAIPYVNAASNYLTAFNDNSYRPDQAVTREDVTMAMVKLKGYDLGDVDYSILSRFRDVASISNYIKVYVAIAVEKGLINGFEDNTFRGQATLTRAEAATLLWRAFQFGNDNKVSVEDIQTAKTDIQSDIINSSNRYNEYEGESSKELDDEVQNQYNYGVETLDKLPKNYDDIAFTKTGELYYLKDNKLYKQFKGKTTEVFDGNTDYYEEIAVSDFLDRLKENDRYWAGHDTFDSYGVAGNDLLYFDTLKLLDLEYSQHDDNVYVCGMTNVVNIPMNDAWSINIYSVSDMKNAIYTDDFERMGGYEVPEQEIFDTVSLKAVNDGIIYIYRYNNTPLRIKTITGDALKCNAYSFDSHIIDVGNELYCERFNELLKYNLSIDSWEIINLADDNFMNSVSVCSYNSEIYFSSTDGIYVLENAGTRRFKSAQILRWSDLMITDNTSMVIPDEFLFDNNGDIIFIDGEHKLLRKINIV